MRGCRGLTGVGLSSGRRCIIGRVRARLVLSVHVLVPSSARGESRTLTGLPPGDFESPASAIPPLVPRSNIAGTIATSNRARAWANLRRRFHPTCGNAPSVTDLSAVADTQHRSVACTQQSGIPRSHLRACTTCILTRPLQVHALPSTGVARRTAFEPAARLPCTSLSTHRWSWLESFLGEGGKQCVPA